jgi:hypothetical protein
VNEHDNTRNGPGDFAVDEPLPRGATEPVDVVQVRADDALIAALGRAEDVQIDDPIDERLAGLLRAWRDDVRSEPQRSVDLGAAVAALASAPRSRVPRQSPFGPLATAAAVLVVVFVGLGLAARQAEPGDALWGVTKVLYSDKARSVEAAVTVRTKLEQAAQLWQAGDVGAALAAVQEAQQRLPVVAAEDGKQELDSQARELIAQMTGQNVVPPPPALVPVTGTTSAVTSAESVAPSTTAVQTTTTLPPPPPPPPGATDSSTTTQEAASAAPGGTSPEGSSPKAGGDPSANGTTQTEGAED